MLHFFSLNSTTTIKFGILISILFLNGCTTYVEPIRSTEAELPYKTQIIDDLKNLPPARNKTIISVYKYKDQSGQYKPGGSGVSYSTAITQGATSMLVKALQDAGDAKWFTVLERESLSNLMNERKIIRNTRKQYLGNKANVNAALPPLLYAPIILEGGIVSYESNVITGGMGARYLGIGGATEFQRDSVTVYLRAVSVKTGEILSSVNTSKTIFSVKVDAGLFKFVNFKELLEVETGFSSNEPPQMAVLEAIEKAVYNLTMEGVLKGLWAFKNPKQGEPVIAKYLKTKKDYFEIDDETARIISATN
jgi:curli production assembly/transport component CsgG